MTSRNDREAAFQSISLARSHIGQVIVGKQEAVDLLLTALIAKGHALLEDVPGTGKTLLAKTLARTLSCDFKRVQFTPDLLPSDLTGINFYNQKEGRFEFRPGPLFTNVLLADEINRATPRTQSSLLECMEERQVTIDGATHPLAPPFFVVATQNPIDSHGTFPLPEAQLDRFLLRIRMGYPTQEESLAILTRFRADDPLAKLAPALDPQTLQAISLFAETEVRVDHDLLGYIVKLTEASRSHPDIALGVSPRGTQALLRAAQAFALVSGRDYVTPDDIKRLAEPVLAHRIVLKQAPLGKHERAAETIRALLREVDVPSEPADALGIG